MKQKQYCNKFNKDFENSLHQKNKKIKKKIKRAAPTNQRCDLSKSPHHCGRLVCFPLLQTMLLN